MYDFYTRQKRCPSGSFSYKIKQGDTLYNLAMKYNTTVEAIMRINPGIDPNNLQIGQTICIPEGKMPPTKCPSGTFSYTIKSGDTLYDLARKYNTTVEEIMRINPGVNPNNLQIGQVICIPEGKTPPKRCPSGTFSYTIKSGDTIYNLARKYNTTVEAIMRVNPGIDPNNLMIGQTICIPRSKPPVSCPGGTLYTVRVNDTFATISLRFNLSYMDLTSANPGVNFENLMVGQQICIMPHQEMGCPCGPGFKSYEITSGDISTIEPTVVVLARKFNISVEELMKANPNRTPSHFEKGKTICVPR